MMKNNLMLPLVSVGIPAYNRPEGLRRTLDCITAQTYTNLEIIVSDNCSPDPKVEQIAREFQRQDSRIKYFRQERNIGPLDNFKFVLEQSSGEYFMWAADDDEWEPAFCETLMEIHLKGNYNLVSSYTKCLQPDGTIANLQRIDSRINAGNKEVFFCNFLRYHHWNYTKADLIYGIYKIDSARKNLCFVENLDPSIEILGGDILFLLSVIAEGNCFYLDKELRIRHSIYFIKKVPYFNMARIIKYAIKSLTYRKTYEQKSVERFTVKVACVINRNFSGYGKLLANFYNLINHFHLVSLYGY